MLKRIADWERRASQLAQEISERVPEQYRRINPLRKAGEEEPVGHAWVSVASQATALFDRLVNLREAIEKRTGKRLELDCHPPASEPLGPVVEDGSIEYGTQDLDGGR